MDLGLYSHQLQPHTLPRKLDRHNHPHKNLPVLLNHHPGSLHLVEIHTNSFRDVSDISLKSEFLSKAVVMKLTSSLVLLSAAIVSCCALNDNCPLSLTFFLDGS